MKKPILKTHEEDHLLGGILECLFIRNDFCSSEIGIGEMDIVYGDIGYLMNLEHTLQNLGVNSSSELLEFYTDYVISYFQ